VFRGLSTNHLIVSIFKSAPEVRDLPSTGVTRLHRYYDPVRLPSDPPPYATLKPRPSIERVSPVARFTLPACRAHYPGGSNGCTCRLLPRPCGLPRFAGGSASASLLSRPAQALLALRPVGLLNRPRRPLSRGFDPAGCPAKPLVSYQGNRQFPGWNLPPLVKRAFRGALHKSRLAPLPDLVLRRQFLRCDSLSKNQRALRYSVWVVASYVGNAHKQRSP